mgnify:CR=1 FL=1
MNIVLGEYVKNGYTAGNKAREDVINILKKNNYMHIPLYRSGSSKIIILCQVIRALLISIAICNKHENIFIQYPYYPFLCNVIIVKILKAGQKIKKYSITMLIHDSMGLRNLKIENDIMNKELSLFDNMDIVICHNEEMKAAFNRTNDSKYKVLEVFDYLCSSDVLMRKRSYDYNNQTIVIAGNLTKEKCGYIYNLDKIHMRFNLYGASYDNSIIRNEIHYCGAYNPDELVTILDGDFGLVWDGNDCESCTGVYGEYLKYNNPHKFSLYLAAGIPVIVWKQSALAKYVSEKKIGICINSLYEISEKVNEISIEQYNLMKKNVNIIQQSIINGMHLTNIIKDI